MVPSIGNEAEGELVEYTVVLASQGGTGKGAEDMDDGDKLWSVAQLKKVTETPGAPP